MLPLIVAGAALGAYSAYTGSKAEEKKLRDERAKLKRQQEYTAEVAAKQELIAERNRALSAKELNSGSRSAAIANFQEESAASAQAASGGVMSGTGTSMGASLFQRFSEADRNLSDSFLSGVDNINIAGDQIDLNNRQAEMGIDLMQYDVKSLSDSISGVSNPMNRLTDMAMGAYSGGLGASKLAGGWDLLMQEPKVQDIKTNYKDIKTKIGDRYKKAFSGPQYSSPVGRGY